MKIVVVLVAAVVAWAIVQDIRRARARAARMRVRRSFVPVIQARARMRRQFMRDYPHASVHLVDVAIAALMREEGVTR